MECSTNYLQCKQLASHLPPTHKHVFDYLTGEKLVSFSRPMLSSSLHPSMPCYHQIRSFPTRSRVPLGQEWDRSQNPRYSVLQSLPKGGFVALYCSPVMCFAWYLLHTFWLLYCVCVDVLYFQDPPGTNYGTGLRAKTAQQMCDRKKTAFVYHFLVNEPDD